jgi:hypothetical protein
VVPWSAPPRRIQRATSRYKEEGEDGQAAYKGGTKSVPLGGTYIKYRVCMKEDVRVHNIPTNTHFINICLVSWGKLTRSGCFKAAECQSYGGGGKCHEDIFSQSLPCQNDISPPPSPSYYKPLIS